MTGCIHPNNYWQHLDGNIIINKKINAKTKPTANKRIYAIGADE